MKARPLSSHNCPKGWNYDCSNDHIRAIGIAPKAFEWFVRFSDNLGAVASRTCALGLYAPDGAMVHGIQFERVQPNHLLGLAYNLFWLPDLHTAKVLVKGAERWSEAYQLHLPVSSDFYSWPFVQTDLPSFQLDPATNLYTSARALWSFKGDDTSKTSQKRSHAQSGAKQGQSKRVQTPAQGALL
ncbi:hypothetical protein [Cohaesibacter celericrescens]|uniref:Uncharacterized protein n=1 Tax=Cohaesibacter celericrescens TaxID=2067669 RepID=A0A2N5XLU5_9HYPH|nr:hypothetical protein [Cohaesibacter celericrescens]PLW75400.1 hypothetical protein C0081_20250 [Cohaesibacter celericrescens]